MQSISMQETAPNNCENNSLSIYARCKTCLDHYVVLDSAVKASTAAAASEIGFYQSPTSRTVEDACTRFIAWATDIAALQQPHLQSSLDSRLREATDIRQRIFKILADLEASLQTGGFPLDGLMIALMVPALLIIQGIKPNERWQVGAISDSEEDKEDNAADGVETSELEELFAAIQTANSSLMKLSIVIRTSPTRDDHLKAASRVSLDLHPST
jgi:hypothetical protein